MNGRRDASSEVAEGAISTSHKPQLTGICKQTPEGIVGTKELPPRAHGPL